MKKYLIILLIICLICISIVIFFKKDKVKDDEENMQYNLKINVNDYDLIFALEDNEAVHELINKLQKQNIEIIGREYGHFEKVGSLGFSLPTKDVYIETKPGDLVLYNGKEISLFYDENAWDYTLLGKIINVNGEDLAQILGTDDVKMTLSLIEISE